MYEKELKICKTNYILNTENSRGEAEQDFTRILHSGVFYKKCYEHFCNS